ncbi:MAG: leucine-rich repeat domain-containing protein [Clostridia bacterium]|nr:leucine-rich repeat domain-containing protein [Clostridia bacterium]
MTNDRMIDAISSIDQKYIIEYVQYETKLGILKARRHKRIRTLLISAACLALAFCLLVVSLPLSLVILSADPVQEWSSQVIDKVIFPLDQQVGNPEDPTSPTHTKLQINWIEWEITEKLFSALGAGTADSVIDKLQSMQSDGLVVESMQDLGEFLERLYEYYMKHKDEIDAIIGETESETETESDTGMETEPETNTDPGVEHLTEPEDTERIIIDNGVQYWVDESGEFCSAIGWESRNKRQRNLVIPSEVQGIPVTSIKNGAFQETYDMQHILEEVVVSEGIVVIENLAFQGCRSLKSVVLPDSLEVLGDSVFYACNVLSEVTFGDNLREIGDSCFHGCFELKEIDLPYSLKTIGEYSFAETALDNVIIPPYVEEIGAASFYFNDKLKTFTFSSYVKTIGVSIIMGLDIEVYFAGTIDEFLMIDKNETSFSSISGTIYCNDGEISAYAGEFSYEYYDLNASVGTNEPTG